MNFAIISKIELILKESRKDFLFFSYILVGGDCMNNYIVEPGDNIASIAKKFNVKVVDLVKENNLENIPFLEPGIELMIPDTNTDSAFEYYVVKPGDSLYQIGEQFHISPEMLAELNGLEFNEYIYPNQKLLVPKKDVEVYITKDGDTLNLIADDLGIPRENILLYNDNIYLLPEQLIAYKIEQ